MGGQSEKSSSAAPLGYLAPLCVAVFFVFVWAAVGTRHRYFRHTQHAGAAFDPENPSPHVRSSPIARSDVDKQFPLTEYSAWWEERNRKLATTHITQPGALNSSAEDGRGNGRTVDADGDHPLPSSGNKSDDVSHDPGEDGDDGPINVPLCTGDVHSLCAICMEGFDAADLIRPLTCGHIFHSVCVDPWLTKRQACCPLCKMNFSGYRMHPEEETPASSLAIPVLPGIAMVRSSIIPHRA
ncbi:hypothetical protein P170DRAFT_470104 [Aspergillus steynii IBT 23096]|uniref:RING-type E3 ubiquitin transferase n=1 Tax=Aspergillus steynii IBT 23096 TaxID=1392250 RepID=A0A2I2GP48_9EURO|nr:uncharacterized protein P170DRAFT_470104 [Aspergillus steynii IBT 23096]PLB54652.1 hypothetical protein P170DRAFT_470104 [Aspergillus steynii IBT 23096]